MTILPGIIKILLYYKHLGEKAIDQCAEDKIFHSYNAESNSIAIIVKHLHGNMRSRWTNFLTEDGEKVWRNRDTEFEEDMTSKAEVILLFEEAWSYILKALDSLSEEDLSKIVFIRNEGQTALEAINRQIAHIAYHTGQIVYLSRMYTGPDWKSLSIPKGKSKEFNAPYFQKEKNITHYTDTLLQEE